MDKETEKAFRKLVVGMNMLADRIKVLEDEKESYQKQLNKAYKLLNS